MARPERLRHAFDNPPPQRRLPDLDELVPNKFRFKSLTPGQLVLLALGVGFLAGVLSEVRDWLIAAF